MNIISYLKMKIPDWDSMCNKISPSKPMEFLILTFEGNKIIAVLPAENAWVCNR